MSDWKVKSESSQALVLVALALPVFFSIVALAVDGSTLMAQRRTIQNAADAAALAAAQDAAAVGSSCNAACQAAIRPGLAAHAASYSAQNGGPAVLNGGSGADPAQCSVASDTNCYTWPYPNAGAVLNGKVEIRLRKPVATFFTGVIGLGNAFDVSARAVASARAVTSSSTTTIPGTTNPGTVINGTTFPGTTNPGTTIFGTTTNYTTSTSSTSSGSTPAVIFAYSTGCDALRVHNGGPAGSVSIFNGSLVSNGAYDIDSGVHGDLLRHRDNTTDGTQGHGFCGSPVDANRDGVADVTNAGWNGSIPPGKPDTLELVPNTGPAGCTNLPTRCFDWPIGNPTLASCQTCAPAVPAVGTNMSTWWVQERATNGTLINAKQCTNVAGDGDTFDVGQLAAGNAYCDAKKITVKQNVQQVGAAGVALVAPDIVISASVRLAPLAALYNHPDPSGCATVGGLQIFAWDNATSTVDVAAGVHWGGGMFVPNGGVSINSVDSVASFGYIQANTVDYGSGGAAFNGTGACVPTPGGSTTTTYAVTTITTPTTIVGTTNSGTTAPNITVAGTTVAGSTSTSVVTVGTSGDLDE